MPSQTQTDIQKVDILKIRLKAIKQDLKILILDIESMEADDNV